MTLRTCTFRPIPYVVPPLYNLCVLFMILYSTANCFRAWIAYEEKKISKPFRLFCQICYVNLAVAGLLFSLCFAVQPTDHESLIVHTGPFAYFTIALVMNQVSTPTPWLTLLLVLGKSSVKQNSCLPSYLIQ